VAVAGPSVNVLVASVLGATLAVSGGSFAMSQATTVGGLIAQLMWINIGLAVFNLLPAFPMDGGRVFRAILAFRLGRERATSVAASASKLFAVAFVIIGLGGNLMLCLIGVFVWFTAQQEAANVALGKLLAKGTVADAMLWTPHSVDAGESVDEVAARIIHDGDRQLAVFERGQPAGIVMSADVVQRMMSDAPHGAIGSLMHRDVPVVLPTALLASVLQPLEESGAALVVDERGLVGLLTLDQIATYAALHGVS
jgi:stage IV sporulation protein FB